MISLALILLLLVSLGPNATAHETDKISQNLDLLIEQSKSETLISAVVFLRAQADITTVDADLHNVRATRAYRHRIVLENLRTIAEQGQSEMVQHFDEGKRNGNVEGYKPFWIVNAILVRAKPSYLREVSLRNDVQFIDVNLKPVLIEPAPSRTHQGRLPLDLNQGVPRGIRAIHADRVWHELGITGAGRLVSNLDTGVEIGHPALSGHWRGNIAPHDQCWRDEISVSTTPSDTYGHGTHTMGTICGNSTASNDSIGVAPNAYWIACRALDQSGGSELDNDILDGFQWLADPDGNAFTIEDVPDVISNSWGVSSAVDPSYPDCFTLWNNVIINCEAAGVVVLFSAGNSGTDGLGSPATIALDSVTNFAVGAVDATNDTIPPYNIANFSSRGPSSCPPDTATKPEVSAPGVDVYSSLPGSTYGIKSGTSMACPHVAGVVALMREASPDAEVRDIKSILMQTAVDQGSTGDDNTFGRGVIDAYAAVQMLLAGRGFVAGVVRAQTTGNPVPNAAVHVLETNHTVRSNALGAYLLSLPADSLWHVRYESFGFRSTVLAITVSLQDTLHQDVALAPAPLGTLSGLVVAASSVPLENASVTLMGLPVPSLVTDSVGRFSQVVPGDASYTVHVSYQDAQFDTVVRVDTGQTTFLTARLSSARIVPLGPDAYGYRGYDRYDSGYAPGFHWIEITPSLGGPGTRLTLPARDSSAYVALPFPFRFYGQTFTMLTINENGWLAPGVSHDHSFFNFAIPSPSGPSGMLAPLWDNLSYDNDADLCYWADTVGGRFIVEYRNVAFASSASMRATLQIHIISTETQPTPTGDCDIEFLYRRVDDPGYCTVGIEDVSETVGLQALYNASYHPASWQIGAGAAMRFSTRAQAQYGTLTGQISAHPPVSDVSAAQLFVGGRVLHPSVSGNFRMDSLLTGTHNPRLQWAGYESDTVQTVIAEGGTSAISFEVWRLDPPREVTGNLAGSAVELRWHPPAGTEFHLDALRNYSVWRDSSRLATVFDTSYTDAIVAAGRHEYFVTAQYDGGESLPSNSVIVVVPSAAAESPQGIPTEFALEPCHPNPFNPSTVIRFNVPRAGYVQIAVFDLLGRHVTDLLNTMLAPGYHSIPWDGSSCGSGLYVIVMTADGFHAQQKAMLIR